MNRDDIVRLLLVVLAVLCVGNLNGVAYMLAGVSQAFSLVIGFIAVVLAATSYQSVPQLGWYTTAFIVLFLLLSLLFSSVLESTTNLQFVFGPVGFGLIMLATSGGAALLPSDQIERLLTGLCWLLALISVATVLSPYLVAYYEVAPLDSLRSSGLFLNPNAAAVTANIGCALGLSCYFDSQRRIYIVLALISAAAIFVTFSKTGFITLFVLAIIAVAIAPSGRRWQASSSILVIGVLAVLTYLLWLPDLHALQLERISAAGRILFTGLDEELSTGRTIVWQVAASNIADHGVFTGMGLGTMRELEGGVFQRGAWQGAHNFWLVLVGESGLIPAIMFALLLLSLALRCIRVKSSRYFVVAYIVILVADTMASHHIFETRYHAYFFGLVIGLTCADGRRSYARAEAIQKGTALPIELSQRS